MPVTVTLAQILQLAPNIRSSYRAAFESGQAVLDKAGITDSPRRLAHFMAQVLHESGGLTIQFENLNYSAERLPVVWPKRFKPGGPLDAADYAHNPEKLANEVYGGRMGNTAPGDGFTYRGRGLLQLTGKESYQAATHDLREIEPEAPDLVAEPDQAVGAGWCLQVAAYEWVAKGCNAPADADDVRRVTKLINGGLIGLAERVEWLRRCRAVWS